MSIQLKRVYDKPQPGDGYRVLVDRLWPRGLSREAIAADAWLKAVAPSAALRKWFNHDPSRWTAFRQQYQKELKGSEAFAALEQLVTQHGTITLLYGAKDEQHNQAVVLQALLGRQRKAT